MDDEQRRALRDALAYSYDEDAVPHVADEPPALPRKGKKARRPFRPAAQDDVADIPLDPSATAEDATQRPLAFSGEMVRALLEGRKHVTRRPVQPPPLRIDDGVPIGRDDRPRSCPLGRPGDVLWVREKWAMDESGELFYAANPPSTHAEIVRWRGGMSMPRTAARLRLTITAIHAEPLHAITPEQALAEGCPPEHHADPLRWFQGVWQHLYGKTDHRWSDNPAVWVIAFER